MAHQVLHNAVGNQYSFWRERHQITCSVIMVLPHQLWFQKMTHPLVSYLSRSKLCINIKRAFNKSHKKEPSEQSPVKIKRKSDACEELFAQLDQSEPAS